MNTLLNLKLIVRSWWRNKMYFLISLFSLTIGLACTNLLMTFFIHEYNLEGTNPNRENIYILRQDSPMEDGEKVTFTGVRPANQIKNNYPEITSMLRVGPYHAERFMYQENEMPRPLVLQADSTLPDFFPYNVLEGSLREVLTSPGKIALSENYTRRLFGNRIGIGETIEAYNSDGKKQSLLVAAILEERSQSFLQFDILTGTDETFIGGATLLKLPTGTDDKALLQKIREDKVPTMMPGQTQYYLEPIKEIYFGHTPNSKQEPLVYLHQTNVQLLHIALVSALLVLVIACFNFSNLNLSRTLQQLKMIHIEKLMGAKLKEIRTQLFLDASLTVFISFLLALLLLNDILPWFNELLSVDLSYSFFFNGQVLPLLLGFIFLLAVVPGIYISYRLSRQSINDFRIQYTGRKKQTLIGTLACLQFLLSIGLVYATTVTQDQLNLMKRHANRYENMIEIGDMFGGPALHAFQQEVDQIDGVETTTLSSNSILSGFIMQLTIQNPDGTEEMGAKSFIHTDSSFFQIMNIRIVKGMNPQEALNKYESPFYINEKYAQWANIQAEDIGVKRKKELDPTHFPKDESILAGIIENVPTNSLQEQFFAQEITLHESSSAYLTKEGKYLQIRLIPDKEQEAKAMIQKKWEEMFEGRQFLFFDTHQLFMERNKDLIQMSNIMKAYSCIAIFLTCFGILGISWYAVRQRTREIAIRKVHGASMKNIVWLLNRPFLIQILIAYIIAIPLGWKLMLPWLEQFTERTGSNILQFVWPLVIVSVVAFCTVSFHVLLALKSKPTENLKME